MRGGSAVAESSTGPRNRNENGFCSPPVKNSSTASSAMSNASSQAARSGSSRCVAGKRTRSADIEPGGERDDRQAGPDRQLEVEPDIDHQHRGGLADHREPAQPHQRVEAHAAPGRRASIGVRVEPWRKSSPSAAVLNRGVNRGRIVPSRARTRRLSAAPHSARACALRATRHASCPWMPDPIHVPRQPAIAVDQLVKVYKTTRASTAFRLRSTPGSITGLLGGNGAGKTTTIAMILGLVMPTSGSVQGARRRDAAPALPGAAPDEFRKPLYRHAAPAHACGRTSRCSAGSTRSRTCASGSRRSRRDLDLSEFLDRPVGQALGRAEDPRGARQGADQFAPRCCCSTSRPPRSIPTPPTGCAAGSSAFRKRARRDRAARLPQHGRGRAPVRARHHHEARAHRGRRHAGAPARPATAARRWKRCSSTSRAAAAKPRARPRNERATPPALVDARAAPRRRDGAALSLSAALVLDAAARADLLAGGAAVRLGLPAALHHAECRLLRPRRRHVHRRGADVGHPVPRPARLLGLVSGGDVVAQPEQPDDQPAAADRVRLRADDHEHHPARHRHGAGHAARRSRSSTSTSTAWALRWRRSSSI